MRGRDSRQKQAIGDRAAGLSNRCSKVQISSRAREKSSRDVNAVSRDIAVTLAGDGQNRHLACIIQECGSRTNEKQCTEPVRVCPRSSVSSNAAGFVNVLDMIHNRLQRGAGVGGFCKMPIPSLELDFSADVVHRLDQDKAAEAIQVSVNSPDLPSKNAVYRDTKRRGFSIHRPAAAHNKIRMIDKIEPIDRSLWYDDFSIHKPFRMTFAQLLGLI